MMNSVEVKCPNCRRKYIADQHNTRFTGRDMRSACYHCGYKYNGKFLTFLIRQEYSEMGDEADRFEACKRMIDLCKMMEKSLNPEPDKPKAKKR